MSAKRPYFVRCLSALLCMLLAGRYPQCGGATPVRRNRYYSDFAHSSSVVAVRLGRRQMLSAGWRHGDGTDNETRENADEERLEESSYRDPLPENRHTRCCGLLPMIISSLCRPVTCRYPLGITFRNPPRSSEPFPKRCNDLARAETDVDWMHESALDQMKNADLAIPPSLEPDARRKCRDQSIGIADQVHSSLTGIVLEVMQDSGSSSFGSKERTNEAAELGFLLVSGVTAVVLAYLYARYGAVVARAIEEIFDAVAAFSVLLCLLGLAQKSGQSGRLVVQSLITGVMALLGAETANKLGRYPEGLEEVARGFSLPEFFDSVSAAELLWLGLRSISIVLLMGMITILSVRVTNTMLQLRARPRSRFALRGGVAKVAARWSGAKSVLLVLFFLAVSWTVAEGWAWGLLSYI